MKKAFTLIELIFAIVVMGIVAMISTNIISSMYSSYIRTNTMNRLQAQTTSVIDIISKRLSYRVKESIVTSINGDKSSYLKLTDSGITGSHNIIEWIGYDNEGLIGGDNGSGYFQGWSGLIDLNSGSTGKGSIHSPGSRFDLVNQSIEALSYGNSILNFMMQMTAGMAAMRGGAVVVVPRCSFNLDIGAYGYLDSTHDDRVLLRVSASTNDVLKTDNPTNEKTYCERYNLAWTAYAIEKANPTYDASGNLFDFDLALRYDYQPWENESYTDGFSALLAEHVTTFRFIQVGGMLRVKLCLRDPVLDYGFCKEKAVY